MPAGWKALVVSKWGHRRKDYVFDTLLHDPGEKVCAGRVRKSHRRLDEAGNLVIAAVIAAVIGSVVSYLLTQ